MQKIKRFFKKADPVTLALVALLGVSTVFAWVQITGGFNHQPTADNYDATLPVFNPADDETIPTFGRSEVFEIPIAASDHVVPTTFFEPDTEDRAVLASGLFYFQMGSGKFSHHSAGMSFACTSGDVVNVVAPLSGTVSDIIDDDPVRGTMVTIDHVDGLQTVLIGVYDVTVTVGAEVEQGQTLGTTGVSRMEPDSGNVVHLEVFQGGHHVNPANVIGEKFN